MPNTPVLAAATGLPAVRPPLAALMRQAHAEARENALRLPYAARFRLALCRAWRDAKATLRRALRILVEDRIERLIAFLDHLDGDADLEPALDIAEHDTADDEPSFGALEWVDQRRWNEGDASDREECAIAPPINRRGVIGRGNPPMLAAIGCRPPRKAYNLMEAA